MTHDDAFLQAILEDPDDDTPRLVYADWLDDHGRPERAEFIRLQCRLARLPAGDGRRQDLEAREGDLLGRHRREWLEPLGDPWVSAEFRRGFVWGLGLTAAAFVGRAEHLFRMAPLRHADLYFDAEEVIPRLAASPWLLRLTSLRLRTDLDARLWRDLLGSPQLANLTALDLLDDRIGDKGLRALVASHRMARLRELRLGWNGIGSRGLRALAASPLLGQLTHLSLFYNEVGGRGAAALARSARASSLTHLDFRGNFVDDAGG
jgi:uncharacterized protein (TIGR02996 family)